MLKKLTPHILFIPFLLFTSCSNQKQDNLSHKLIPQQELKIILSDPVETLDPLKIIYSPDWKVASNIFDGLVSINETNKIVNELAKSIELSDDKLVYKFELRDNIYFQDSPCFVDGLGRELNSYDVKNTFRRLANKKNKFPNWQTISNKIVGIKDFRNGTKQDIVGIKIIDSLKFEIRLLQPFASFLKLLTSPNFYIIPHEALSYYDQNFGNYPVGTGPFRVAEHKKYEQITLVRNERYHKYDENNRKLPILSNIKYTTIAESENRFSELIKTQTNLIHCSKKDLNKFSNDTLIANQFKVKKVSSTFGVRFWAFYFSNGNDSEEYRILRAVISNNYDKSILKNSTNLEIAESLVPKFLFSNQEFIQKAKLNHYQLEKEELKKDTVVIMANLIYEELLELEKTLNKLNIPYKRVIKPDNYYGEINNIKPTIFRVSMIPSFPDPSEYYSLFYSKNSNSVNLSNFSNTEYDEIYEYVQTEDNAKLQFEAYKKMEEILADESAAIYLTHQTTTNYIYPKKLKNVKFKYIIPDFSEAYFE